MEQYTKKLPATSSIPASKEAKNFKPSIVPNALKTLYGGIEMNENPKEAAQSIKSPIMNKIGNVFIPVRDIEKARTWYCKFLGLNPDCEIMLGHLCPLPMEGAGVILDTMPMWGGKEPGGAPNLQTPAFMFMTNDLQASYNYAIENNVTLVTDIQHDKWFVIKDPDDNMLMICKE
jgi:catechol 2,3-dioxygenase-like lactoylglutathione lyase family enzyme